MISRYATETIEELEKEGLRLTPADIIRLNALGLKIDRGFDDNPLYTAPRCAFISDVVLREPTIGHSLFAAECFRFCDVDESVTRTCLYAWLLTLDAPPSAHPTVHGIRETISHFIEAHYKRVTFSRLSMAVDFCLYGYDSTALERAVKVSDDGEQLDPTADDDALSDAWSFDIGLIHEAQALGLGISLRDARSMTRAHLNAVMNRAIQQRYAFADPKDGSRNLKRTLKNKWIAEFEATVDSIRARHSAPQGSRLSTASGGSELSPSVPPTAPQGSGAQPPSPSTNSSTLNF